jgi:hypothetical protein
MSQLDSFHKIFELRVVINLASFSSRRFWLKVLRFDVDGLKVLDISSLLSLDNWRAEERV